MTRRELLHAAGGALLGAALLFGGFVSLEAHRDIRPDPSPGRSRSDVAHDLSALVAPVIVKDLSDRKEEIIGKAGGWAARNAVRAGFPVALHEVPELTEVGVEALLGQLGGMSGPQIAATLVDHNKSLGRPSHPSLVRAARGQ